MPYIRYFCHAGKDRQADSSMSGGGQSRFSQTYRLPEIPFDTEKGIIVGNIRMGFGHYRISIAMASAAHALGYTPYWMDLNSYPTTTCTKVISAQNDLYSMGSRLSQKSRLFNKKILGAAQLRRLPTADLQFRRPEERGAYGAGI